LHQQPEINSRKDYLKSEVNITNKHWQLFASIYLRQKNVFVINHLVSSQSKSCVLEKRKKLRRRVSLVSFRLYLFSYLKLMKLHIFISILKFLHPMHQSHTAGQLFANGIKPNGIFSPPNLRARMKF